MTEPDAACTITIDLRADETERAPEIYDATEALLGRMGQIGFLSMKGGDRPAPEGAAPTKDGDTTRCSTPSQEDTGSVSGPVNPREIWDQRKPPSEMVWALCPHMEGRQLRDCERCPEWEKDRDYGKVQRGCYLMASEGCRVVFAMLARRATATASDTSGSASNTESSPTPTPTVAPPGPTAADYHFELRFMDDWKVDCELALDHFQVVLRQDERRLSISLSGAQYDEIKDLPILADRLMAPGPTAGDVERAREYIDDWFGLGQWPPVHKLDHLLVGFSRQERASAYEELRAQIREPSEELFEPLQNKYWQFGKGELAEFMRALADTLTQAAHSAATKPEETK